MPQTGMRARETSDPDEAGREPSITLPDRPALDPVLYARVIMACKSDNREKAVVAMMDELHLNRDEATSEVDRLWTRYEEQIHPYDLEPPRGSLRYWIPVALAGVAAGAGAVLWHLLTR